MKWLPDALKRIRGNIIIPVFILLLSHGEGGNPAQCIYKHCHAIKEGMLNVHLVAHTHDDVGWLKTLDQYYDGSGVHTTVSADGPVRTILNSATEELAKSPDRKFIYVEMAFFSRWWNEIDEDKKALTRKLVENGQLEFTSGGWSMNDEATAHYADIIQQFTLGLRFLNDTFGPCATPRVAWQIDTFGHSKEQAALSAALGFDAMFFGRLDYIDKTNRLEKRAMEMIWEGDRNNLGKTSWLYTSVLYNLYQPPKGFCFDTAPCSNPDLIPQETQSTRFNHGTYYKRQFEETLSLKERIDDFIRQAEEWAKPYRTQNILMTMGSDFTYVNSKRWFDNLDILIKEVNARQNNGLKVNLLYSTPGCYLQEVNRVNLTWPIKTDDFFPYASESDTYWTGFYTSRPTFKYFVRKASSFLQGCQRLAAEVAAEGGENFLPDIFVLEEALGVVQHHDAITGTSKQHVIDDYTLKLDTGIKACQNVISSAVSKIEDEQDLSLDDSTQEFKDYQFCPLMNISSCPISESETEFILSVYNPLARNVSNSFIRIPISSTGQWKVEDERGEIHSQFFPIPVSVLQIPGRVSNATHELVFKADVLPGLSVKKFKISLVNEEPQTEKKKQMAVKKGPFTQDFDISNALGLTLTFSGHTGLLKSIKNGDKITQLNQNYYFYEATRWGGQRSGAYIFEPSANEPGLIVNQTTYHVIQGRDVMEVHQVFTDWLSQVIRVYIDSPAVEIEWLAGPIPTDNSYVGRELVTRFSSDLATRGTFYTDANGRQLVKRKRNKRRTYTFSMTEPVSGNYYPVNTHMLITEGRRLKHNRKTLILLTDRPQGGTSLNDGEIEMMIHRRLLSDDGKGMSEALNERNYGGQGLVTRGKFWLIFGGDGTGTHNSIYRTLAQEIYMEKILLFRKPMATNSEQLSLSTKLSMLVEVLPQNVHLLTLHPVSANQFLIRFEHFYEKHDNPYLSKPALISYQNLKEVLNFRWIRETTLGANQWSDEASRLDWKTRDGYQNLRHTSNKSLEIDPFIMLSPFQIRTFIFET